ncbi:MAG: cardiolipin synthase [Alistipes senegalensis]|nr:cardiolipin synthase [Alistipes senegalensis]
MEDEKIIKLLPKRKKGLLKIVFSRTLIIGLLIAFQIFMLASIYIWFIEFFPPMLLLQGVFSVGMIIYLFNSEMDSSGKLTWLFIISMFPIPGTVLLWFTKRDIGNYALRERVAFLVNETKDKLRQDTNVINNIDIVSSCTDDLCYYLNRSGCFPVYANTDVIYFSSGEEKFEALIEELRKAEKFIFLEYFIIDEGYMWGKILAVLKEKAEQGVDVRVMYDGMCEITTLSFDYPERMAKLGIKCKNFSPIRPFLSTHYNYRDHRKILVIDGKTAFNGGINLADEYINRIDRFGYWKDTAVMLKGEAVQSFTLMFLQMWNVTEKSPQWDKFLEMSYKNKSGQGFVMPYADCPLDDYKVGENVYIDILNRATSYVHIMTPYLIIDDALETALKFTAQRGVDVKIILPGIPDKKMAYALAKSHYKTLIKSGVKIYEYTTGFVHAKVWTCDNEKSVVGTINLDYRSLYHHFECATYMYKTRCIPDIERDFTETLSECREVTSETIKNEKFFYKFFGAVLKIIAPLM